MRHEMRTVYASRPKLARPLAPSPDISHLHNVEKRRFCPVTEGIVSSESNVFRSDKRAVCVELYHLFTRNECSRKADSHLLLDFFAWDGNFTEIKRARRYQQLMQSETYPTDRVVLRRGLLLWSSQWKKSRTSKNQVANCFTLPKGVSKLLHCRRGWAVVLLYVWRLVSNYNWHSDWSMAVTFKPLKIFAQFLCREENSVVTVSGIMRGHSPCTHAVMFYPLHMPARAPL